MNAAAYVDPLGRPRLTISEVGELQMELASERITPARRAEIRVQLQLAGDREEVALMHGTEPPNRAVFSLCRQVLAEDHIREQAAIQRRRDARKATELEERRVFVAGRPGRFAALPGHLQATLFAGSHATDARAGWKAYGEALVLQAAGKPIPVPWLFETELLTVGDLRHLQRQGLVDDEFVEEAERRAVREGSQW